MAIFLTVFFALCALLNPGECFTIEPVSEEDHTIIVDETTIISTTPYVPPTCVITDPNQGEPCQADQCYNGDDHNCMNIGCVVLYNSCTLRYECTAGGLLKDTSYMCPAGFQCDVIGGTDPTQYSCDGPYQINATCDNEMEFYVDGTLRAVNDIWADASIIDLNSYPDLMAISCVDYVSIGGIIASTSDGMHTDNTWRCTSIFYSGWQTIGFDDSGWPIAFQIGQMPMPPWGSIEHINPDAYWIWTTGWQGEHQQVYCRKRLAGVPAIIKTIDRRCYECLNDQEDPVTCNKTARIVNCADDSQSVCENRVENKNGILQQKRGCVSMSNCYKEMLDNDQSCYDKDPTIHDTHTCVYCCDDDQEPCNHDMSPYLAGSVEG